MRFGRVILFGAAAVAIEVPAQAQLRGERHVGCISTATLITATGKLATRHFPGPPNYESVRKGDKGIRPEG